MDADHCRPQRSEDKQPEKRGISVKGASEGSYKKDDDANNYERIREETSETVIRGYVGR